MLTTAKRIIKQIFHDKRSMMVMILGPILMVTLMYLLLGKTYYKPTVALDKQTAESVMGSVLAENFENSLRQNTDIVFEVLPSETNIASFIEDKKADAVITFDGQDIKIVMLELVSGKLSIVSDALKSAADSAIPGSDMTTEYLSEVTLPSLPGMTSPDTVPKIALQKGTAPEPFESSLRTNSDIAFVDLPQGADVKQFIEDGHADAVIIFSADGINITMSKMDLVLTPKITDAIRLAATDIKIGTNSDIDILYGSTDESTFDSLAYYLLGVLSFFLIFIFAGVSFVRERTTNTLERLMRTPVRSASVVGGYSIGFGFFAVIQSVLIILYSKFVLNTLFVGDWWLAMIFMLLIAIVAVMMGMFVSIISKTEFQVVLAIPILIVPQIFFSGLIPVDMLPYHLNILSYFMPLYYSGMGLKYVMVYGYGVDKVWPYAAILIGIIALLFVANVAAVQKTRQS